MNYPKEVINIIITNSTTSCALTWHDVLPEIMMCYNFLEILPEMQPESEYEATSNKPKLRGILTKNLLCLSNMSRSWRQSIIGSKLFQIKDLLLIK